MYEPIRCAHCGQLIDDILDCVDAQSKSYHETCFLNCASTIMLENGLAEFRKQTTAQHEKNCIKLVNLWQKNQNEQEIARLYIHDLHPVKSDACVMYHGTIIPSVDCPTCIVPWYIHIKKGSDGVTMSRVLDDDCIATVIMDHAFSQTIPDIINAKLHYDEQNTASLVLGHGEPGCNYDDSVDAFFMNYMNII